MSERVLYEIMKAQTAFDSDVLMYIKMQDRLNWKLAKRLSKQKGINLLLFGGLLFLGSELVKMKREIEQLKEPSQGKGVSDEC